MALGTKEPTPGAPPASGCGLDDVRQRRLRSEVEAILRSADPRQHLCSPADGVVVMYDSGWDPTVSWLWWDLAKSWSPLLALPLALLTFHGDWLFAALLAVTVAVATQAVALLMRKGVLTQAVYVTPDEIGCRAWYGRWRRVPRSAVLRAFWATVDPSTVTPRPPIDYLLLLDDHGRCRLRAEVSAVSWEDRASFVAGALRLAPDLLDGVLKPAEVRRRFPGSVCWYVAHPWLGAILVLGLALTITVGVLMALAALGNFG